MVYVGPDTTEEGVKVNLTNSEAPKPQVNLVTEAINSAVFKSDKDREKSKALKKAKNFITAIKNKLQGNVNVEQIQNEINELGANEAKDKNALEQILSGIADKTDQLKKQIPPEQQQAVETEAKSLDQKDEEVELMEDSKSLLGEPLDLKTANQEKRARIRAELEARIAAAEKVREVLGIEKSSETQRIMEANVDTNNEDEIIKTRMKQLKAIEVKPDQNFSYTEVLAAVNAKNPKMPEDQRRKEALRVSTILDEQKKLPTGEQPQDTRSVQNRNALVNDLRALASDSMKDEKLKTGKYLQKLRRLSGETTEAVDLEGGVKDLMKFLEGDVELHNKAGELRELLKIEELKRSFVDNSDEIAIANLTIQVFEDDIRRKLADNETLYTPEEIKKRVNEMFPPNLALAAEAASEKASGKSTKKQEQLQRYILKRMVLEQTLSNYQSKIDRNIRRYETDREGSTQKLVQRLQTREQGRIEVKKGDTPLDTSKFRHYLTNSGNTLLVTDDIEQILNVAPDLKDAKGKVLTREEVRKHIEEDLNYTSEKSFQMAVKLQADSQQEEETVLVVYKKREIQLDPAERDRVLSQEELNQLKAFGYHFGPETNTGTPEDKKKPRVTADDADLLTQISGEVIYHEATHGVFGEYISATIDAIDSRLEEVKADTKLDTETRNTRIKILEGLREKIVYKELGRTRWKNALEELAAKVEERTYPEYRESVKEEDEKGIGITLSDIYIYNPENDPSLTENNLKGENFKEVDTDLQYAVDLVNKIVNSKNRAEMEQKIRELYQQQGVPIYDLSVEKFLSFHILSYVRDGSFDDLKKLIENLKEIAGEVPRRENPEYLDLEAQGLRGVLSADENARLRDPVTIANAALKESPLFPKQYDGHLMAPMHTSIPIPGLDFVYKYSKARLRYHMFKPMYKQLQNSSFQEYWENISSDPLKVTEKDKGQFFTPEILGAWVRQAAIDGQNPDTILGQSMYKTDSANFNSKRGTFSNIQQAQTDKRIDTGIAGKAMATWSRTPGLNWLYPRYHSAPWGMAMEKALGRGPVPRLIGRVLWGQSVMPDAESYQKVGFNSQPKWRIIPGYREGTDQPLEPDNQPGTIVYQEGNLTPRWNHKEQKWELHSRIPVESVLPSMEYNRAASLRVMLGMMAKSGVDEQALRFMIMKYLPELNLGQREGIPGYDISEYKDPLKDSDLHYERRIKGNRMTIAKFENDVRQLIFGNANVDGNQHDLEGFDTNISEYRRLLYLSEGKGAAAEQARQRIEALDTKLSDSIEDREIIRGNISEETVEEMIDFLENYYNVGLYKAGGPENGRVKDHPFMIRHVFRAMNYENAIRRLRKQYLRADSNAANELSQWNEEIQQLYQQKVLSNPNKLSRLQLKEQAYQEVLSTKTLTLNLPNGPVPLNGEQIQKLFVTKDAEGGPHELVFEANDDANTAYGLGDLEKIAFDTEWNKFDEGSIGRDFFTIGGGFRLHKLEVQAFLRTLQYVNARDIMRKGLPPDAINMPGETSILDRTLTSDLWERVPYQNDDPDFNIVIPGNPNDPNSRPTKERLTYKEGYFNRVKRLALAEPEFKNQIFEAFEVTGNTDDEKLAALEQIFLGTVPGKTPREQGFQKVIDVCNDDPRILKKIFGQRAELQATFLNERNQLYTIKPTRPATELDMRFFDQGAIIMETEEHMTRIEEQMAFYTLMRLYLTEARRAIPMAKARSEIFKKQAQLFKYFRWGVLAFSLAKVMTMPGFFPTALPLAPGVYAAMIALSYYESYFLSIKQKYWGMRELNAIKYADEVSEFTARMEQALGRFEIPSEQDQEQYGALKNRYEKFFEGISDVDKDELSAKPNAATTFVGNAIGGLFGG